jgi:hypothetical protein
LIPVIVGVVAGIVVGLLTLDISESLDHLGRETIP